MNELGNLEVFELMQAIYPEKFKDEDDATFEAAIDFFDELLAFACGRESQIIGRRLRFVMGMRMWVCAKCALKKKEQK